MPTLEELLDAEPTEADRKLARRCIVVDDNDYDDLVDEVSIKCAEKRATITRQTVEACAQAIIDWAERPHFRYSCNQIAEMLRSKLAAHDKGEKGAEHED